MRIRAAVCVAILVAFATGADAQATRVTYAREALEAAPNGPVHILGANRVLVDLGEHAVVLDLATLEVVRRHNAPTGVELLPSWTRKRVPVLSIAHSDETISIVDPDTGAALQRLGKNEHPMLVSSTERGLLTVTHNGTIDRNEGVGEPLVATVRVSGQSAPVAVLPLGRGRNGASTPKAAVAYDGMTVGLIDDNQLRLIDMTTGKVMKVDVKSETPLVHLAFMPSRDRIVLLPEKGPLIELDRSTRVETRRIPAPDLPRRWELTAYDEVIEIEGRRQRAIVDATSGTSIQAARAGSGTGFLLAYAARDIVLRGSSGRPRQSTSYGIYKRERSGFKPLYKHDLTGLTLSTLAVSPNGACLFLATPTASVFRDVLSHREIETVAGLRAPLQSVRFALDGKAVVAVDQNNTVLSIAAPAACHGASQLVPAR